MKIAVDKVVYDVVKEKEMNGCTGCLLDDFCFNVEECRNITNINCIAEKVIFLKVPDSLKNCENCKHFMIVYKGCYMCENYEEWEAKE